MACVLHTGWKASMGHVLSFKICSYLNNKWMTYSLYAESQDFHLAGIKKGFSNLFFLLKQPWSQSSSIPDNWLRGTWFWGGCVIHRLFFFKAKFLLRAHQRFDASASWTDPRSWPPGIQTPQLLTIKCKVRSLSPGEIHISNIPLI